MKKVLLRLALLLLLTHAGHSQVLLGTENGASYTTATWTNGAPAVGLGSTWFMNLGAGASTAISDSTQNGRTSIGSSAFFTVGSTNGNFADVFLPLGGSLSSGQSISLNANYSWNGGTRGIEFEESFGAGGLFRFEHGGGSDALRFAQGTNSVVILSNAFNQAFTYSVAHTGPLAVSVSASLLGGGSPFFATNLTLAAQPNQVKFYVGGISSAPADINNYGLYANAITTVPEPSTYALLALGGLGVAGYLARRRKPVGQTTKIG